MRGAPVLGERSVAQAVPAARLRRPTSVAVTAVVVATAVSAWVVLGQTAASASARRLSHSGPNPQPTYPVSTHGQVDPFCAGAFFGRPLGSLTKTTSAGPTGSTVLPGQSITVTLTWSPRDFGWRGPTAIEDCVKVGRHVSAYLSQAHRPGSARGRDTFKYDMPTATDGEQVCDRGVALSVDPGWNQRGWGDDGGPSSGGYFFGVHLETSPVVCYTILAAAAPEASQALLFPVAGLVVVGGGYWLARGRRRRGSRPPAHAAGRRASS